MLRNRHFPKSLSGWLILTLIIYIFSLPIWLPKPINAAKVDIVGPPGSQKFGENVVALPNGNFVVIDSQYDEGGLTDIGAAYLYNGTTLAIISILKGSQAYDRIGFGGITILSNGNFVVISPYWRKVTGAVTWCNAVTGCNGVVTASNSLVGSSDYDAMSTVPDPYLLVTPLTNGNYVVSMPYWDNPNGPISDAGAAAWGNGATGTSGLITQANSLVGGSSQDNVGVVVALPNGNYLVASSSWNNPKGPADVGAVTWGNGTTGTSGLVGISNSLIGGTQGDGIGGATVLPNSNYVISSPFWDNPVGPVKNVGAATWCNGATGATGLVDSTNSLIGGTEDDRVGGARVTALANGNYVVLSPSWDNPAGSIRDVGAATWGNGATGIKGLVTSSNSLIGANTDDNVGTEATALTNGHYVVSSQRWNNPEGPIQSVGAVTWCNGVTGRTGVVTAQNSLTGSSVNDRIGGSVSSGNSGVTALTNGNYVVRSPFWDNPQGSIIDVGAVTWGNGSLGIVGTVNASNSLIGQSPRDYVGGSDVNQGSDNGITALTNGNYIVNSPKWNNPNGPIIDAGAVTWCNGAIGCTGLVTQSNSLIGGTEGDNVGYLDGSSRRTALANGNYVVVSPYWTNPLGGLQNAGAVTWGNGTTGLTGIVSASNSLVGERPFDAIYDANFVGINIRALANGNYVVRNFAWDNPIGPIYEAGAITCGNGLGGTVGSVSSTNSVMGTTSVGIGSFDFDSVHHRLIVGHAINTVTLFDCGGNSLELTPKASLVSPSGCLSPGNKINGSVSLINPFALSQTGTLTTNLPTQLIGLNGSCDANFGTCTISAGTISWSGSIAGNQTLFVNYQAQVADDAALNMPTCVTTVATFNGASASTTTCLTGNCPAAGPGSNFPAPAEASDQKVGSVLIYNVYTSSTDPTRQNTRINLTNSDPQLPSFVHLFFVAEGCSVADSYVCLTANQTASFLASDLDPGTSGYLVAVAVDAIGCPTAFNHLLGDEYVKFASGHAANLNAVAFAALPGGLPTCDGNSVTAALNFDGLSYNRAPRVLALSNVGSRADGNDTLLILNRIGGNLGLGASTLSTLFGILYDDAENALSFQMTGSCQLRNSITNNFPRTAPRFETFVPAGRSGWLKVFSQSPTDIGILGALINFNANAAAAAGAFNQGHNLHALTLSATNTYIVPIFPPGC